MYEQSTFAEILKNNCNNEEFELGHTSSLLAHFSCFLDDTTSFLESRPGKIIIIIINEDGQHLGNQC